MTDSRRPLPSVVLVGALLATIASASTLPKESFVLKMLAESPPTDDRTIVPGWRIGAIHLGMTLEALSRTAGTPDKTYVNGPSTHYIWTGRGYIDVTVEEGRVVSVTSGTGWDGEGPSERGPGGVTGGTPQIELVIAMGEPALKMFAKIPKGNYYCYFDRGTYFFVDLETSRVTQIGVQTKKLMKEWCE